MPRKRYISKLCQIMTSKQNNYFSLRRGPSTVSLTKYDAAEKPGKDAHIGRGNSFRCVERKKPSHRSLYSQKVKQNEYDEYSATIKLI